MREKARRCLDSGKITMAMSKCSFLKSKEKIVDYPKWRHWDC